MISSSRAGASERPDSRSRSAIVHVRFDVLGGSGMFSSRDAGDGFDEELPRGALGRQHPATLGRQLVEPPATFAGLFHPGAQNPATLLESVEQGIQRGDVELQ